MFDKVYRGVRLALLVAALVTTLLAGWLLLGVSVVGPWNVDVGRYQAVVPKELFAVIDTKTGAIELKLIAGGGGAPMDLHLHHMAVKEHHWVFKNSE